MGVISKERHAVSRAADDSQLNLFWVVGLVIVHGTIFRLVWVFFAETQGCYPVWDFWLFGQSNFSSVLQLFQLTFLLLAAYVLVHVFCTWRTKKMRRALGVGYGFVLAWLLSAVVLLSAFYGMMVPDTPEERLGRVLHHMVRVEYEPPYNFDGEPIVMPRPFGLCGSNQMWRYLWDVRNFEDRDALVVKKSFFEERNWMLYKPAPPPRTPDGLGWPVIDGEIVPPDRFYPRYYD